MYVRNVYWMHLFLHLKSIDQENVCQGLGNGLLVEEVGGWGLKSCFVIKYEPL